MSRVHGWDTDLYHWSRQIRGSDFVWGSTDCVSLVATASRIMYDDDPFPDAPNWSTRMGALRHHSRTGGVAAWLREAEAAVEIDRNFISEGDIIVEPGGHEQTGLDAAGVYIAGAVFTSFPDDGVVAGPVSSFGDDALAFRVQPV